MGTVLNKEVINKDNTYELATRLKKSYPLFDVCGFHSEICNSLPLQSMGERIQQVRKSLYNFLPKSYKQSVKILLFSLPKKLETDSLDKLDLAGPNGFIMISLTSYISKYGMDDFNTSMKALKEMTKCFSSKSSIRYFIEKYPNECNKLFDVWVRDPSPHIRRLVSEGLRPRLPMAIALKKYKENPRPVLKYLETLKDDSHLFIRRSVANNLNDISKDHPEIVTELLRRWNRTKSTERQWLIKHALRTLEKKGNSQALKRLGFLPVADLSVSTIQMSEKTIRVGASIEFCFTLKSTTESPPLLIDYIIYFNKLNGKQLPKVFKLKKLERNNNLNETITKSYSFKKINTRKYYPGIHYLAIQINGVIYKKISFELLE